MLFCKRNFIKRPFAGIEKPELAISYKVTEAEYKVIFEVK